MLRMFFTVGALGMAAAMVGCEENLNDRPDRLDPVNAPFHDDTAPLPGDRLRDDLRREELRREELRQDELWRDDVRGERNRRDDGGVHVRWPGGGVDVKPRDRALDRDLDRRALDRDIDIRTPGADIDIDRREPRRIHLPNVDVDVRNQ